jgi:nitrate/TMAO reductase-like tetraheme cytochrome c subunit
MSDQPDKKPSRLWAVPKARWRLGIPLGALLAFGLGAVALGTTNYVLHETSTTEFCYTCHSHEKFIKPEYEASSHFANAAGVRAECADCHLPHDNWFELVWTKAVVSLDIIPELQGKLDTAEKYEAHRAEMAEEVWRQFKENDSKFCRSCHSIEAMNLEEQERQAARRHSQIAERGQTCIDCHYGIVHVEPEGAGDILERIDAEMSAGSAEQADD